VIPELRFARSGGSGLLTTSRLQTTLSFIGPPAGPGLTLGTARSRGRPILHENSSILTSPGQATSGGRFIAVHLKPRPLQWPTTAAGLRREPDEPKCK